MGEPDFDFEASWRAVEPEDVLCLIYTSGTTGPPKGVQLTHANMVSVWRACDEVQQTTPGGRMISYLPSAHIADRWAGIYAQMIYGSCVYCCPDPRQMVAYSIEVKPTVWGGVPRIWEKLKAAIEIGITAEPDEAKRDATVAAIELGRRRARAMMDGGASGRARGRVAAGRRAGALDDPRDARPRSGRVVRRRGGADPAGGARVLPRARDRDPRDLGHVGDHRDHDPESARRRTGRHRRPADPQHRGEAGRGRRGDGARPAGDGRLPQPAREDGGGAWRGRLAAAPATSANSTRPATCGSSTARRS